MAGLTRIKSDGIGDDCDLDGEGTLVLDSTNNRVGIGTGSPRAKVDFGAGTGHGALNQTVSNYQAVFESPQGTGNIARNIAFAVGTNGIGAAINAVDNGGSDATGLMFATGTAGSISEKLRINSSGNVGIGTTAPTSLLHLAANAPYITFEDKDNNQDWQLQATAWFALRDQTAGEERLRIDSSGRIGIGSGSQDLSAFNANGSQDLVIYSKGTSGLNAHAGITLLGQSTTASQCSISFADGASGAQRYAGAIDYFHSNDSMSFRTSGNAVMRIDSSGNVGIGTTSPDKLLHVDSSGNTRTKVSTTSASSFGQMYFGDEDKYVIGYRESHATQPRQLSFKNTHSSGIIAFRAGGDVERMRIDSSGLVTLKNGGSNLASEFNSAANQLVITNNGNCGLTIDATSSTSSSIHFADGASGSESYRGLIVYSHSNDMMQFGTAGTGQKVNIDSSGNLLIGTTAPKSQNAKLTVQTTGACPLEVYSSSASGGYIAFTGAQGSATPRAYIGSTAQLISGGSELDFTVRAQRELSFATNGANERLRINDQGRSYHYSDGPYTLNARTSAAAGAGDYVFWCTAGASGVLVGGSTVMAVYTNGNIQNTNNSYGAISDIKLKENIVDANSQWDDLKALQVRNYNFKEGQTHTQIGLIAQEVELVSPGLVSESPDRDEEGNDLGTVTKSVSYSVLYMKAVKALQEAMERIETLEAEVAALKSN